MSLNPTPTNWNLPQNTEIITFRHPDGYYMIPQGRNHIFEFFIPHGGFVRVKILNTAANCQDLALRGYFSFFPLGESINISINELRWFAFPRLQRVITLVDELFAKHFIEGNHFAFPAGRYYLNIQNLTNVINGYHLRFEEEPLPFNRPRGWTPPQYEDPPPESHPYSIN